MRRRIFVLGALAVPLLIILVVRADKIFNLKSYPASVTAPISSREEKLNQTANICCSEMGVALSWKAELADMEARLKMIEDAAERESLITEFLNRWPDSDCSDLMAWVQGISDEALQSQVARCLLPHLLKDNLKLAADFVVSLPDERTRCDLLNRVIDVWDSTDWQEAFIWLKQMPNDEMKTEALLHLSYYLEKISPQAALAYFQDLPTNNGSLIRTLTSQWAVHDPVAAATWAAKLPEGENRDKAISSLVAVWSQKSPPEAADFVIRLPAGEARDQSVISVVSAWSNTDPETVAQWIDQFPESDLKEKSIEQVLTIWASKDPVQAGSWLRDELASSPTRSRDAAVKDYSQLIVSQFPATAFLWAEGIRDESLRESQMETIAQAWLNRDPIAAKQTVISSTISDHFKAQFLGN